MAKMFYTTEEAAAKLSVSPDQLKQYVTENKLREFRDGARVMFKVDQVDRLVTDLKSPKSAGGSTMGGSGIQLSPVDSGPHDALSLADSDVTRTPAKEDTVVTNTTGRSRGGSKAGTKAGSTMSKAMVFDESEVKPADASAQTQMQSSADDQLSLEAVGSGSGLLDLTRESDDTSLGAELLDEIYPGGDQKSEGGIGSASGIFEQPIGADTGLGMMAETTPVATPVMSQMEFVEASDPSSGAFGGMALAAAFVMGVTLLVVSSAYAGYSPEWVESISSTEDHMRLIIFSVVLLIIAGLFAGVGYFIGKATTR